MYIYKCHNCNGYLFLYKRAKKLMVGLSIFLKCCECNITYNVDTHVLPDMYMNSPLDIVRIYQEPVLYQITYAHVGIYVSTCNMLLQSICMRMCK